MEESSRKKKTPSKLVARRMQQETEALPSQRSGLLLRLTADMFRQHSELYLKQAAVLERVASNPADPLSWQLEEESPENLQDCMLQENAAALAVKGYQSMLQVQKRVDYLERLMIRNGVGRSAIVSSRGKSDKKAKAKEDPSNPFYWFLQEHKVRIGDAMGQPHASMAVRQSVLNLWKNSNPAERKPYILKAERRKRVATVSNKGESASTSVQSEKRGQKVTEAPKEKGNDSESNASSCSEEEALLFQKDSSEEI